MSTSPRSTDALIIGGGLAGLVAALELLDAGRRVTIVDRDRPECLGGLAKESFGGIFVVGSREQRRLGIRDTPELAFSDWQSVAEFEDRDSWPRRWAEAYVHRCRDEVYDWLRDRGVRFFPVVHWVERGMFTPGNSVPRFHMVWGTGFRLVELLVQRLEQHPARDRLELLFGHRVLALQRSAGTVCGCAGEVEESGAPFELTADAVVVAAGGICGSDEMVRQHWYKPWGSPPPDILNGAHRYGVGDLHTAVQGLGGVLTHLDLQWHYAAGVRHPSPNRDRHGLSLVPPKSALWVNAQGRRIGPIPLVTAYDTRFLVREICRQPGQYSWQIMNWKIACQELAVSGADYNDAIRHRRPLAFIKNVLLGNPRFVRQMLDECADFVAADSIHELAVQMNTLTGTDAVDPNLLAREIASYDEQIARGPKLHNDEQLRRIAHARQYRGDRVRTCKFQSIDDPKARPLIAVHERVLARKSLGGIQTDLDARVLDTEGDPIPGLWAVGEAAGFGGGGIHGKGSLEGTFLGSCVLTARAAARSIVKG